MWQVALETTTVALSDDEIVGFVQSGAEGGDSITPSLIWGVVRAFGFPGVIGFVRRDRARARVHVRPPEGAYHIAEIHVRATRRNLGIGAALLGEAERAARARGAPRMSLSTTTNNPARHLYERFGFRVAETREESDYLALTGISGRILMVKDLA
jgi:ribosomal protein S18 acetylase RimI-like enzyme